MTQSNADWLQYVSSVARGHTQAEIARRTGLDNGTISRWLNPHPQAPRRHITPTSIRAFARAYERSTVEAFIHAGLLTREEAETPPPDRVDLTLVSDAEFLAEVERRLAVMRAERAAEEGITQ